MAGRACTYEMADGRACRATPRRESAYCFWHDPETVDELAEARRTGGFHRRKKRAVATIYDFNGMRTIDGLQGLLETITIETLYLENSIARNRTVSGFIATGAKLLEVGDLAGRLATLEALLQRPTEPDDSGDLD